MPQGNYLPPFSWLRAFEATARLGSFTHAANDLFITQSAISQHIRNLEMHLNTRLFIRRSRGVELTDMGKAYLPAVQDSFQRLKTGTQDLFGGDDQSASGRGNRQAPLRGPLRRGQPAHGGGHLVHGHGREASVFA